MRHVFLQVLLSVPSLDLGSMSLGPPLKSKCRFVVDVLALNPTSVANGLDTLSVRALYKQSWYMYVLCS